MLVDEEAGPHGPAKTDIEQAVAGLSDRQIACLARAGEGLSSKEIGRLLGISPSTVDNHIHAAVAKLHARNRKHAAQLLRPIPTNDAMTAPTRAGLLPPIGGSSNRLPSRQRLRQMLTIAIIALIALTSAYAIILGSIEVFGRD